VRIVCVGGGPAGLWFSALVKQLEPGHEVTVLERYPAGVTHGWGVVFSEALLAELFRTDPVAARQVRRASRIWQDQLVHVAGRPAAHLGGYGYTIGRQRLLDVLAARAVEVGVEVRHEADVSDDDLPDADLVVASDGVHSRIRRRFADAFGTRSAVGDDLYIWLGTTRIFDAFTFGFERTDAGWLWFHAYRFDEHTSTFIAECSPATWRALGLDGATLEDSLALLERVFARHLGGHRLLGRTSAQVGSSWLRFTGISNERWSHENVVLLGDAAHTAHFSIGSGTTLAMHDAIVLAEAVHESDGVPDALRAYHDRRLPEVLELQREAASSARWFEHVEQALEHDPVEVGWALLRRRFSDTPRADHTPLWRYAMYRATQQPALRAVRQGITTVRRRRGERSRRAEGHKG
jgi:anthraniloyl-CoA monooxygenase